jgi:hypothetical protein
MDALIGREFVQTSKLEDDAPGRNMGLRAKSLHAEGGVFEGHAGWGSAVGSVLGETRLAS